MTAKQTTEKTQRAMAAEFTIALILQTFPKDERAEILKELNK